MGAVRWCAMVAALVVGTHAKRDCDYDCQGGRCLFEQCEDPTCRGGACEFIECTRPTCEGACGVPASLEDPRAIAARVGGACTFRRSVDPTCKGGGFARRVRRSVSARTRRTRLGAGASSSTKRRRWARATATAAIATSTAASGRRERRPFGLRLHGRTFCLSLSSRRFFAV